MNLHAEFEELYARMYPGALEINRNLFERYVGNTDTYNRLPTQTAWVIFQEMSKPIDMVLHCPRCHAKHIDMPEPEEIIKRGKMFGIVEAWTNPPHRSHLCHECNFIWRPADVYTNGVVSVKTKGKNDGANES